MEEEGLCQPQYREEMKKVVFQKIPLDNSRKHATLSDIKFLY